MKKIFLLFVFALLAMQSYSQPRLTYLVTKKNDTISRVTLKMNYTFKNDLLIKLQEKLVVQDAKGITTTYLPEDVKSFTLYYDGEKIQYESVENKTFAILMYADKLRLLKINTRNYFVFIIERPNDGRISYMEAMGLSRLISEKVITRELGDCPDIIQKVNDKVLKVHGMEGVIELAKYYEANCLK